jgi:hypothetical protein
MNGIIKAIMLGVLLQITVGTGLTVYLFNHTSDMALQYAQMAERNANTYTDEVVRDQYNRLQIERSQEREDMRQFLDRRIDLKIDQAMKGR